MARLSHFISMDRNRKLSFQETNSSGPLLSPALSTLSDGSSQPDLTIPLHEWESLQRDLSVWHQAIRTLEVPRIEPNMPTPFGPALIYSDLRCAAATMLFLASQIHLVRSHPTTPSAPPAAIGMTAPQTGALVAEIMRIQEGLWDFRNFRVRTTSEAGRAVGGEGRTVDHVVSALANCAW